MEFDRSSLPGKQHKSGNTNPNINHKYQNRSLFDLEQLFEWVFFIGQFCFLSGEPIRAAVENTTSSIKQFQKPLLPLHFKIFSNDHILNINEPIYSIVPMYEHWL